MVGKRWPSALLVALVLAVAGCQGGVPPAGPAGSGPTPSSAANAPSVQPDPASAAPGEPAPGPVGLGGEPVVEWTPGGDPSAIPVKNGVCSPGSAGVAGLPGTAGEAGSRTAGATGPLSVTLLAAEWRLHPLGNGEFWSPAVVLTACNTGDTFLDQPSLLLAAGAGPEPVVSTSVWLPSLKPGQGTGPIRVYTATGVPAQVGDLWAEDGRLWPNWTIRVLGGEKAVLAERPVARVLGGAGSGGPEAASGAVALPDPPPLPLLRRLAWSQGSISPDGGREVAIFLYAPDATYSIMEHAYCGALTGQIGVSGQRWALYTSVDGDPPIRAWEIGELAFEGGRGMVVETVPALQTTFLLLGWYGTCANPNLYDIYAFDHATGEFYRPQMRREDGSVGEASVAMYSFTPDGRLLSSGYVNAGDELGWHIRTYRWDPQQRMWLFESRVRSDSPFAPGAAEPGAPGAVGPAPAPPGYAEYEAARQLMAEGKWLQAIGRLEAALATNPDLAEAWNALAYALLRHEAWEHVQPPGHSGRYQEAIDAAREALALRPGWDEATYTLGLTLLADGRYQDALIPLQAAANQFPDRPDVQTALGLALIGAGRSGEAIPVCRRADGLQAEFVLADGCLREAGAGFAQLPDAEAAVGHYRYEPEAAGFGWSGPPREVAPELGRISPPWTCALTYPDGFRESFVGCNSDEPYVYGWSFTLTAAGTTPAGIGVGTPWAQVLERYGPTWQDRYGVLWYRVAGLHLAISGSVETGVQSLSFSRPTPYFLIDDLIHGRTAAPPLGWGDDVLEGIRIMHSTREEAEALLGPGAGEENPWVEVRTYQGGRVRLVIQDSGIVSDVTLAGEGSTPRGVAIGDSGFQVRRRYGRPDVERPGEWVYLGQSLGKQYSFQLTFYLEHDQVQRIALKVGR